MGPGRIAVPSGPPRCPEEAVRKNGKGRQLFSVSVCPAIYDIICDENHKLVALINYFIINGLIYVYIFLRCGY